MTSRLDRLVTLLETGSTQLIRNTAASQLGDVQKQHPDELFNLLARVVPFLRSRTWDTRTAAAKAIGAIAENAPNYDPNSSRQLGHPNVDDPVPASNGSNGLHHDEQLNSATLNVSSILRHGKKLLGSAENGTDHALGALDSVERLEYLKKTLDGRLGLRGKYVEETLEDIFPEKATKSLPSKLDTSVSGILCKDAIQSPSPYTASPRGSISNAPTEESGLSKRQLNQLKRKNKLSARQGSNKVRVTDLTVRRQSSDALLEDESNNVKSEIKSENDDDGPSGIFSLKREEVDEDAKIVSDFKGSVVKEKSAIQTDAEEAGLEWPYERLCEFLKVDLFDPNWEIRHGAAMGLREIVRIHGAGAGRLQDKSRAHNDELNSRWLDDLASRLCCVLMLDRYGDYANENVVAIIRETVGQTLGALLVHLPSTKVIDIYQVLYKMVIQKDLDLDVQIWQVCQGGMIGLRYLVAVRTDLLAKHEGLLDGVVDAVMNGLAHGDDDVRAVSAATLTPIAKDFVAIRPAALSSIMSIVWNCLADLSDDLSASTGNVMDLLAKLSSFPEALRAMQQNALDDPEQSFEMLVPRLYPFLRHTITGVRSAVLRALQTFLKIEDANSKRWVGGRTFRLLFQNLMVERNERTLNESLEMWKGLLQILSDLDPNYLVSELSPVLVDLLRVTLQPIGTSRNPIPMDLSLFMRPNGQMFTSPTTPLGRQTERQTSEPPAKRRKRSEKKEEPLQFTHNLDGPMIWGDVDLVGMDVLIRSRTTAARAFGKAFAMVSSQQGAPKDLADILLSEVQSPHSSTQLTACIVLEEYASETSATSKPSSLADSLRLVLEGERPESYADMVPFLRVARAKCHSLLNCFRDQAQVAPTKLPTLAVIVQGEPNSGPSAFSIANADAVVNQDFERLKKGLAPAQRLTSTTALKEDRVQAVAAVEDAKNAKAERDTRVRAAAACALVALREVPKKPSALIKAIMDSIKLEENSELQRRSARGVASLIEFYAGADRRGPADKIIGNLVKFYCTDTAETPEFSPNATINENVLSLKKDEDRKDIADAVKYQIEVKGARITRRGAKEAFDRLTHIFGGNLFHRLPILKQKIEGPLLQLFGQSNARFDIHVNDDLGQDVVDGLCVLRALSPSLHVDLFSFLSDLTPIICKALQAPLSVFRYAAAKCLATICDTLQVRGMTMLVQDILPLSGSTDLRTRQGVIELIYHLIQVMGDNILPYTIFLIVHVLGRMSDSDSDIRLLATTTFATLVKLVPLEAGIPDPPGFPEGLLKGRDRERQFIAQMLDPKKVEPFELPVTIKAELRSYQQEGVNWLAFLNRHHLHGILCDDMGLGKTLQTLCIVASDHHMRAEAFAKTQSPDSRRMPSLIVCPPTLSGHWQQEIRTFASFLSCLAYVGPPNDRAILRKRLGETDIVITSYDVCRNDQEVLTALNWNYCVLDEGHLIKNPRAKTSIAVKRLASNHRLILSGTPIQNNVVELWSLFDFLMPGFLGTEKIFQDRFAKPIAASRFSKSSSKEQEAGALAIEALHKQVLPFLLRRLKEEVLDDLPPKILQNYYCDLSGLQRKLFEDFVRKERKGISEKAGSEDKGAKQHIFQALQYMRKLCNSPSLVVREGHKQYPAIQSLLAKQGSSLRDIAHAPKLSALRDLLLDCGIGSTSSSTSAPGGDLPSATETPYVSPHRALIFCQMKEMLDIVQSDVLHKLLPTVQYLRLDGSVDASKRQDIVNKFNTDPSYDVLLLTTQVGGLGLNLTGADTVIFVEHSWNPQQDIQAMDRAHRIGQKKVVNVYRLVTRGTLEEKILNLQRFKIDVASTVVNQQNSGLATMETDQILDLFNLSSESIDPTASLDTSSSDPNTAAVSNGGGVEGREEDMLDVATGEVKERGKKGWLDGVGELVADEGVYEREYDLEGFVRGLRVES